MSSMICVSASRSGSALTPACAGFAAAGAACGSVSSSAMMRRIEAMISSIVGSGARSLLLITQIRSLPLCPKAPRHFAWAALKPVHFNTA
jgi:hypothetical protein